MLNFADWLMREDIDGPRFSHLPPSNQRSNPKEQDILDQVDAYMVEEMDVLEEVDHSQNDESKQEETPSPRQSSSDASTSTSGTTFA